MENRIFRPENRKRAPSQTRFTLQFKDLCLDTETRVNRSQSLPLTRPADTLPQRGREMG